MIITLFDSDTLLCSFPYSAAAVASIKALPERTYDGNVKGWLVPVASFDELLGLFPDASVDVDVWEAVYPTMQQRLVRVERFCRNLVTMGVSVVERAGLPVAVGKGVSPLLRAEVEKRAAEIRMLWRQGLRFEVQAAAAPVERVRPAGAATAVERGIVNAAKNAQREAAMQARRQAGFWQDVFRQVSTD